MFAVLTCIFVQHDLRLVAAAALICVVASATAFGFFARGLRASGALRWSWLSLTGLVAGSGVWATHFLAMLAYQPSLKIGYDLAGTVVSLIVSVLGMCLGFSLPALRRAKLGRGRSTSLIGGAVAGASIAVMHYVGIAAIRAEADMSWNMAYVAASLVMAVAGGMGAFSVRNSVKGDWAWAPPAGVFVLGIVGLHFTAMTAVTLTPDQGALTLEIPDWGSAKCVYGTVNVTPLVAVPAKSAASSCGPGFHAVPETDRCDPDPGTPANAQPRRVGTAEGKFPMAGQSLGGIMRSSPSMSSAKVMSLAAGSDITLVERAGAMDGYDWFKVQYRGQSGYQWGGIMCSNAPIRGIFQQCEPR